MSSHSHSFSSVPRVVATVPCGVNPAGMGATKRYLYVANNNNYSISGQDSVTVIDLKTFLPFKTIYHPSFSGPYTITIKGHKAYVTNSNANTISVIDTKTNEVCKVIDGFDGPSGLAIVENIGYVNNYGATPGAGSGNGKTVSVLDLSTYKILHTITIGLAPASITAYKNHVYTINYEDGNPNTGTMTKISAKSNKVVDTLGPFSPEGLSGPFAIEIRHGKAYVSNFGSNNFDLFGTTMSVVDLKSKRIVRNVTLGIQPSGLALTSRYAYVSNYNTLYAGPQYTNLTAGSGSLSIVDLETYDVVGIIRVEQSPANVLASPCGKWVFVSCYTGNVVNLIRI